MNNVAFNASGLWLLTCAQVWADPQATSTLPLKPAAAQSFFINAALSMLLAGFLLALVFYGLLWWRKRSTGDHGITNEAAPVIKSLRRVTQKSTLVTVAWQGKIYLLAENQGSLSVLDSMPIEAKTP